MGNEKSALNGIEIDEKAIEVTDFWTQYSANVQNYNSQKVSVFNSEPSLHYTASFGRPTPLERIAKVSSSVHFKGLIMTSINLLCLYFFNLNYNNHQ